MVADLEAARKTLGLDRFVLIGHSIYGLVVLAYAHKYPEHVRHVIATGAPLEYSQEFVNAASSFWDAEASPARKAQHTRNTSRISADSVRQLSPSDAFIANYIARAARYWIDSTYDATWLWKGIHVNARLFSQILDVSRPFQITLNSVKTSVPAFVALGRYDFVVPYTLWDHYQGPFTNLTIKIFDRAGHTPQLEDSASFDKEVLAWLNK